MSSGGWASFLKGWDVSVPRKPWESGLSRDMSSFLYSDHVTAVKVGAESVRIIKQLFHNEVEKTAAP